MTERERAEAEVAEKKLAALLAVGGGATAADAFDQTPVEFGR